MFTAKKNNFLLTMALHLILPFSRQKRNVIYRNLKARQGKIK